MIDIVFSWHYFFSICIGILDMILLDLCWEVCLFLAHHGRVQRESHTKIRSTAIGLKSHYPVSTELGNRLTDINLWHYENSSILWRIVRLKRKDKSAVCWAVLASVCQHCVDFLLVRWTSQPWPQDWKGSVFIPIPKKGNAKECSITAQLHSSQMLTR